MRLICPILLCAVLGHAADDRLPAADDLLRGCVGALPDVPLRVTAELQSRNPDGDLEKKVNVDMTIDWQARPPTARYSTRDAFGKALEHLAVTWHESQPPEYHFFRGEPLVAAPLPPLTDGIEGTDITWMDLTLAYMWWPDGRTVGAEEVRGRTCWIVDVPAPTNHFEAADGVRLWIDAKVGAILRAHVHAPVGALLRRVDVKGFKKIGERWFVQLIEVESRPSKHSTVLRVREVEDRQRKQFIKVDEGGPAPAAEEVDPATPAP
jgi:hypothetical protein